MAVSLEPTTQINGPKPLNLRHILTNQNLGLKSRIWLVNLSTPRNKLLSTNIRRSLKSLTGKKIFTGYSLCDILSSFQLIIARAAKTKWSESLAGTLDIECPHLSDKKVETRYVIESNSGI